MANTLTDDLFAQLQGAPLQQMAQQLGLGQTQTAGAVSAALPLLLGALGRNASQPQGADALFGALQTNHAGVDLGSVLGAVLGGEASAPQADGARILGHIFGGQQARAETGLGQATGLGSGQAGQLLKILAPIVMAYLAKRLFSGPQADAAAPADDAGPQALGDLLGREHAQIRQGGAGGLLGSVLDQDGDGEVGLGDLLKIGGGLLGGKR